MKKISQDYFNKPTEEVARDLLGANLVRKFENGRKERRVITETEAYLGEHDLACHASKGRTKRTEVMFGPPGYWYVYLIYGMYDMLNVVTGEKGSASAVLIRGLEGFDGPGKLTRGLNITKSEFNTKPIAEEAGLWLEKREQNISEMDITVTPRIGIDYAGEWKDKLLRFVLNPAQEQ